MLKIISGHYVNDFPYFLTIIADIFKCFRSNICTLFDV